MPKKKRTQKVKVASKPKVAEPPAEQAPNYSDPKYIKQITEQLAGVPGHIESSVDEGSENQTGKVKQVEMMTEEEIRQRERMKGAFKDMMYLTKEMSSQKKGCMGMLGRWAKYLKLIRLLFIIPVAGLSLYSMLSVWQIFKEYPDAKEFSNLINPLNTLDFGNFDPFDPNDEEPSEDSTDIDDIDNTIKDIDVNDWKDTINEDNDHGYTSPYDDPSIKDFSLIINGESEEFSKKECFEGKVMTVVPIEFIEKTNSDTSCSFASEDGNNTILFVLHQRNYATEVTLLQENHVYAKAEEIGAGDPSVGPLDITFGERTYQGDKREIAISQNSTFATIDMEGSSRMIGLVTDPSAIAYDFYTFDFELSLSDSTFEENLEVMENVLMVYTLVSSR